MIRWEEPPPRRAAPAYDWPQIAKELQRRPGKWALIAVCPNTATAGSTARHIRNGAYEALRSVGIFDAVARTIDGEARVYAQYLGGPA